MSITKEEFEEWKAHPVTIEIYQELKGVKEELKKQLGEGSTIGSNSDVTQSLTSRVVGQIAGLNQLLELTYEDVDD